jgi:sulfur-carrier protein
MKTVRIPPTLRAETGGERQVTATGGTVRELLDDLISRFPGLRSQLVEDDEIAPFVNVYVEGEDVRTLDGLETPVQDGDTVILLPAMAGGS